MIAENITEEMAQKDVAESLLHNVDRKAKSTSGVSLFHILTGAAIVTSVFLFLRGHPRLPVSSTYSSCGGSTNQHDNHGLTHPHGA